MICLSRKTEYALLALGYLAERPGEVVAARDLAEAYALPAALLMNILKTLQQHRLLRSRRGMNGGYQLGADLERLSLHDLIRMLEEKVDAGGDQDRTRGSGRAPIAALHFKLMRFLHEVTLADLVLPGRRIDVPVEVLKIDRGRRSNEKLAPMALAGLEI
jgi:Rrf2 family protein